MRVNNCNSALLTHLMQLYIGLRNPFDLIRLGYRSFDLRHIVRPEGDTTIAKLL